MPIVGRLLMAQVGGSDAERVTISLGCLRAASASYARGPYDPEQLADSRRRFAARAIPYGEFSDRHLTMALMLFRNR